MAVSDDERVVVLAAFDKELRLEAQVLHDRREIFRQQMYNRLQLEVKVAVQKVPNAVDPPVKLSKEEIDRRGHVERGQCADERQAARWSPGPRDAASRTTQYVTTYDEVREIDRQFVLALPANLTDAGLLLRRAAPVEEPTTGRSA